MEPLHTWGSATGERNCTGEWLSITGKKKDGEIWRLYHTSCVTAWEWMLLLSGGEKQFPPHVVQGIKSNLCSLLCYTGCYTLELCCGQAFLLKSRWSVLWSSSSSSVGYNDNCTGAESMWRHHSFESLSLEIVNLQLSLPSADQVGARLG